MSLNPLAWMDFAACHGEPLATFFLDSDDRNTAVKEAKERRANAICSGCPVLDECFAWAIDNERHGFWAGMNEEQRAAERRRRMRRERAA